MGPWGPWGPFLTFVLGLLSGALLEPIKVYISKKAARSQLRIMLYQDIGKCLAVSSRISANVVDTNERQVSDDGVLALVKSLNISVITYARTSKPEIFYDLPYEERGAIEHIYSEVNAWLSSGASNRQQIEKYARRVESAIRCHCKQRINGKQVKKYEEQASQVWAAGLVVDIQGRLHQEMVATASGDQTVQIFPLDLLTD